MKKATLAALLFTCCLALNAAATDSTEPPANYCDDADGWAEWKELVDKHPADDNLASAYALRIGLCQQVKEGTIESSRAIAIFERFFDSLKEHTAIEEKNAAPKTKELNI